MLNSKVTVNHDLIYFNQFCPIADIREHNKNERLVIELSYCKNLCRCTAGGQPPVKLILLGAKLTSKQKNNSLVDNLGAVIRSCNRYGCVSISFKKAYH